jgi:peptide/nickel transport system permease protein
VRADWIEHSRRFDEIELATAPASSDPDPPLSSHVDEAPVSGDATGLARFRRRFFGNRFAVAATVLLLALVLASVLAPLLTPYEPQTTDLMNKFQPPSRDHWLGTDDLGRDVYTRLLFGGRVSLMSAALGVIVALVIGAPLGIIAGYHGGRWDALLSRTMDTLMSLPSLILSMGIIAALGPGLTNAMIAVGFVLSPRLYRVVRSAALEVRAETFIEASMSIGLPSRRVIVRHALPNVISPLLVQVSLLMAVSLLAEASLSFLGLGVQPPDASWGVMLGRAYNDIRIAPTLIYWPGIAIALASLCFNVLGDGLRDSVGREVRRAK